MASNATSVVSFVSLVFLPVFFPTPAMPTFARADGTPLLRTLLRLLACLTCAACAPAAPVAAPAPATTSSTGPASASREDVCLAAARACGAAFAAHDYGRLVDCMPSEAF